MNKVFWMTLVMLLGLALAASPAQAEGRGRDKDKDRDNRVERRDHDRDSHGFRRGDDRRPPGWNKGKKTGWGNCNVPPGQAKKVGCRDPFQHRHYHRVRSYRDDRNRPVVVRRPRAEVHAQGSVDAGVR